MHAMSFPIGAFNSENEITMLKKIIIIYDNSERTKRKKKGETATRRRRRYPLSNTEIKKNIKKKNAGKRERKK